MVCMFTCDSLFRSVGSCSYCLFLFSPPTPTHTQIVTVLRPLLQNQNLMDRCHSFIRSRDGSALETMPPLVPSTALPHMFPSLRDQPTLMRATGQFGSQVNCMCLCSTVCVCVGNFTTASSTSLSSCVFPAHFPFFFPCRPHHLSFCSPPCLNIISSSTSFLLPFPLPLLLPYRFCPSFAPFFYLSPPSPTLPPPSPLPP